MQTASEAKIAAGRRRLATIVAVDLRRYSSLSERDSLVAAAEVQHHAGAFASIAADHSGRVFHRAGDGFLAEFPGAAEALSAALAFQAQANQRARQSAAALQCRASVHVGEVSDQASGDLLGHGVNVAARLQAEAREGGVIASAAVHALARDAGFRFKRRGDLSLRHIDQPVLAFDVEALETAPARRLRGLWRRLARSPSRTAALLAVALLVNFAILAELLRRDDRLAALDRARAEIATLETRVADLTQSIAAANRSGGDHLYPLAVKDAAKSLIASEVPAKRRAVALIEAGDVLAAAQTLSAVYKEQVESGNPLAARAQTLREIATLTYYADTQRALATLLELYEIEPNNHATAYQLGGLYNQLNQPEEARAYYLAAGRLAPADGRVRILAEIGAARANLQLGKVDEAERDLLAALDAARAGKFVEEETLALLKLGTAAFLKGDMATSKRRRTQALVLARSTDDRFALAEALNTLGTIAVEEGDFAEAELKLTEAIEVSRAIRDRRGEASAVTNRADVAARRGDRAAALSLFETALGIGRAEGMPAIQFNASENIARLKLAAGDRDGACEAFAHASAALDEASAPASAARARLDAASAGAGCGL